MKLLLALFVVNRILFVGVVGFDFGFTSYREEAIPEKKQNIQTRHDAMRNSDECDVSLNTWNVTLTHVDAHINWNQTLISSIFSEFHI